MLNEIKFIKSVKCPRKAWLTEHEASNAPSQLPKFPNIMRGEKNKKFRSKLGEAEVGCVVTKKNGIELYDFHDTVKYRKYAVQMNFKRAVAESCGFNVLGVFVVTVNPNFEKGGKKPFYIFNRIEKPKSTLEFRRCIERVSAYASATQPQEAQMKNDCAGCEFFDKCFNLPEKNIFELKGLNFPDKLKLYKRGIVTFDDYLKCNPPVSCRVQMTGETHIDKSALRAFLSKLKYPLGFLDFETISPIKPIFKNYRPAAKIITQFSFHSVNEKGGKVLHCDFVGDGINNPEPSAVNALLSATKNAKTVLSYSAYEKNCIEMLSERFPQYKKELKMLSAKIIDLEIPFRNHMYVTPLMEGRTSLKYVLPALYPNDKSLDYHRMKVSDGEAAVKAYMSLKEKTEDEREKIKLSLKKYCALDTLALVKITEKLYSAVEE